jgi:leucyl aminopeptidase
MVYSLEADDDGSGTTSTIHAFKALNEAGYVPTESDLEFHWFSAEEGGLLGSQAIAKEYEAEGVVVKAMVQMDMTAWVKKGTEEVVGIITDFVDPALSEFMTKAVGAYRKSERSWVGIQGDYGLTRGLRLVQLTFR